MRLSFNLDENFGCKFSHVLKIEFYVNCHCRKWKISKGCLQLQKTGHFNTFKWKSQSFHQKLVSMKSWKVSPPSKKKKRWRVESSNEKFKTFSLESLDSERPCKFAAELLLLFHDVDGRYFRWKFLIIFRRWGTASSARPVAVEFMLLWIWEK